MAFIDQFVLARQIDVRTRAARQAAQVSKALPSGWGANQSGDTISVTNSAGAGAQPGTVSAIANSKISAIKMGATVALVPTGTTKTGVTGTGTTATITVANGAISAIALS